MVVNCTYASISNDDSTENEFKHNTLFSLTYHSYYRYLTYFFILCLGKDEEPGLLKLLNPVKREGKPDLADIELWPRCVPDGMVFKVNNRGVNLSH